MHRLLRLTVLALVIQIGLIVAHGTVHEPVARQTRWRLTNRPPRNYNDVELWCGGFDLMFVLSQIQIQRCINPRPNA